MVSGPDLPTLHRRYVGLAGRFKAAWTFHQFLQGLQKLYSEAAVPDHVNELVEIHSALKNVSENLSGGGEAVSAALDRATRMLDRTLFVLSAADVQVTPPLLRQFFERVKNYDEQILAQMVRFYLAIATEDGISGDRLDKVDFLLTKLAEETDQVTGAVMLRDPARLRPIFEGLWGMLDDITAEPTWVEDRRAEVAGFRKELDSLGDIESFTASGIVPRYREVKRLLGRYLLQPEILLAVAETNLAFKNKFHRDLRAEEAKILEESRRILADDAAQAAEQAGGPDLSQLRRAYEDVERKQRADNLKVDDLAFLRREVEELRPRLLRSAPATDGLVDGSDGAGSADELLAPYLRELLAALEGTDNRVTPKEAALSRDLFHLRLEAREVKAYRRLYVASEGDADHERFLLESAALRHRVATEATEISEILDETLVTREAPIFDRARRTTQLAEDYVQRFGRMVEDAVRTGNFGEAQQLQLLRMRLIRDYSGLWLLVFRPTN